MNWNRVVMVGLLGACLGGLVGCQTPQTEETAVADEPRGAVEAEETETREAEAQEQALEADDEMARPAGRTLSAEELVANHRMEEFKRTADPEFANPGTTEWRRADLPDSMAGPGMESPGDLLAALRVESRLDRDLGSELMEITARVAEEGDQATGVLLLWGILDDSMIGQDLRLTMERSGEGWMPVGLQERFHCVRGVSGELCL